MAALELYQGAGEVLDLATGQILDLKTATLDELAESREALTDLYHQRATACSMIDAELVRRADEALAAGEPFEGERFRAFVDRGRTIEYDSNAMRAELTMRARTGELPITEQAVRRLFHVAAWRLDLTTWKNMVKRWPDLKEIAERHSRRKPRKARVERRRDVIESTAEEAA